MKIDPIHKERMRTAQLSLLLVFVLGTYCLVYEVTSIRPDHISVDQKSICCLERLLTIVFLLCIAFTLLLQMVMFNFICELIEQDTTQVQPRQNFPQITKAIHVMPQLDAPSSPSSTIFEQSIQTQEKSSKREESSSLPLSTVISARNSTPKSTDKRQVEHEPAKQFKPQQGNKDMERELKERIRSLLALQGTKQDSTGKSEPKLSNSPNNEQDEWHEIEPIEFDLPSGGDNGQNRSKQTASPHLPQLRNYEDEDEGKYDIACGGPIIEEKWQEMDFVSIAEFSDFKSGGSSQRGREQTTDTMPHKAEDVTFDQTCTTMKRTQTLYSFPQLQQSEILDIDVLGDEHFKEYIPILEPELSLIREERSQDIEPEQQQQIDDMECTSAEQLFQELIEQALPYTQQELNQDSKVADQVSTPQPLHLYVQEEDVRRRYSTEPESLQSSTEEKHIETTSSRKDKSEKEVSSTARGKDAPKDSDSPSKKDETVDDFKQKHDHEIEEKHVKPPGKQQKSTEPIQQQREDVQIDSSKEAKPQEVTTLEQASPSMKLESERASSETGGREPLKDSDSPSKRDPQQEDKTDSHSKEGQVHQVEKVSVELSLKPQETIQGHDQDRKDAEEAPANDKVSGNSKPSRLQVMLEEGVQNDSPKEAKPSQSSTLEQSIQTSPIRKQETEKQTRNETEGNEESLKDSDSSSKPISREKDKSDYDSKQEQVERVPEEQVAQPQGTIIQDRNQGSKDAEQVAVDKLSEIFEIPRLQVQHEEYILSDSSKGAEQQQSSTLEQSPSMKQESEKQVSGKIRGKDDPRKDIISPLKLASQQKDGPDDCMQEQNTEQPTQAQEAPDSDHNQESKDNEQVPADDKTSKTSETSSLQVQQSDSTKEAALRQISTLEQNIEMSPNMKQELKKQVSSEAGGKYESLKDSNSPSHPASQRKNKVDNGSKQEHVHAVESVPVEQSKQAAIQDHDRDRKDAEKLPPDDNLSERFELPRLQVQPEEGVQSDSSKEEMFTSEQSIEMSPSMKQESETQVSSATGGKDEYLQDSNSSSQSVSQQKGNVDDVSKQEQVQEVETAPAEQPAQPQEAAVQDRGQDSTDVEQVTADDNVLESHELSRLFVQQEEGAQSDSSKEADIQQLSMLECMRQESKSEAGGTSKRQAHGLEEETIKGLDLPPKREGEQIHEEEDISATLQDHDHHRKDPEQVPTDDKPTEKSQLLQIRVQQKIDVQGDSPKETKSESFTSEPNMEMISSVEQATETEVSNELERRQMHDVEVVQIQSSFLQDAEELPSPILEHTDEDRPVTESDTLTGEATGGVSPETSPTVVFISLRKSKKPKGNAQYESNKHLRYGLTKDSEISEESVNQEPLAHEPQNITGQKQCKTEGETLNASATHTQQDATQEGHDEVDVKGSPVRRMGSESVASSSRECEPGLESNIEPVAESPEQKPSSSKKINDQQERRESECMPTEQPKETSTLQGQTQLKHDDDDVEEYQGEGERERNDESKQKPVWYKFKGAKMYKGKSKKKEGPYKTNECKNKKN